MLGLKLIHVIKRDDIKVFIHTILTILFWMYITLNKIWIWHHCDLFWWSCQWCYMSISNHLEHYCLFNRLKWLTYTTSIDSYVTSLWMETTTQVHSHHIMHCMQMYNKLLWCRVEKPLGPFQYKYVVLSTKWFPLLTYDGFMTVLSFKPEIPILGRMVHILKWGPACLYVNDSITVIWALRQLKSSATQLHLFITMFRLSTTNTSKSTWLALYGSNPPVAGGFPLQKTSNVASVSISWCSHRLVSSQL